MKIFLAADHAGFELKEKIKVFLRGLGHEVADEGAFEFNPADDYPDFIEIVAKMVASDPDSRGIIFGGSGQGEAACANRFKHVRAAVYYGQPQAGELNIIKLSREHNNANVLSVAARFVGEAAAKEAIKLWLDTPFSGEDRHIRRIAKLDYNLKTDPEF
ncbi:MAG TPA: RpiB/LacA/LacB family sugar-phosphate isomerase [Candidatus Paceibacterota bacterium]